MSRKSTAPKGRATPSVRLLTRAETSELTGLTVWTLDQYRQLRRHGIERGPAFVKRGRSVLYRLSDVEAWMSTRRDGGTR